MRIAVCDDDRETLLHLKQAIQNAFGDTAEKAEISCFSSGKALIAENKQDPFSIIFLDIDMPEPDGFAIAQQLRQSGSVCFLIFVTAHAELVYRSFDFQPFHFIRKDSSLSLEEEILRIAKKLELYCKQYKKTILESREKRHYAVRICDIIYIESEKHYLNFYITHQAAEIQLRGNLKDYEERFRSFDFVRIHKRYLVNLRYITDLDADTHAVFLQEKSIQLPLSKNYKKIVEEKYLHYLRSMI